MYNIIVVYIHELKISGRKNIIYHYKFYNLERFENKDLLNSHRFTFFNFCVLTKRFILTSTL